jgi:hypothetical protein
MHQENHEVSRTGIDDCGSNDVRACHEERHNLAGANQGRYLTVECTTGL